MQLRGPMKIEDGLITVTISLTNVHFTQAIDNYLEAVDYAKTSSRAYNWIRSKYNSISSIIHSYSALESVVSETGHSLFFATKSHLYVPAQQRNYTLRKTISNWQNTTCIDKLSIIMEQLSGTAMDDRVLTRLRELNNLRNWLVHGFVFESILLLQENADFSENNQTYTLEDREDTVDWRKKFPNTKFNPLDEIDATDARKALEIALSVVLGIFKFKKREMFVLSNYHYGAFYLILDSTLDGE